MCTCPCCSRQVNFPTGAFRWPVTFMMPNYLTWSHNALKQIEITVPLIYIGSALREHILTSHAILCLKFLAVVNTFCSFDHSDKWNPQVNFLVNDISLFKRLLDLLILDLGAFLCLARYSPWDTPVSKTDPTGGTFKSLGNSRGQAPRSYKASCKPSYESLSSALSCGI